jgi:hypothetical protein
MLMLMMCQRHAHEKRKYLISCNFSYRWARCALPTLHYERGRVGKGAQQRAHQ